MSTVKFSIKTAITIVLWIAITIIVLNVLNNPIITNKIALGQMQNSNELYILMEFYNKAKNCISTIYGCVTAYFAGTIIYDIYQLITTKNKGEN